MESADLPSRMGHSSIAPRDRHGRRGFLDRKRDDLEGWLRQGIALAALFCVTMGAARFLGRYHLVIDGHSTVVAGGSYADIYFWVPAYVVILVCWFAAALLLALAAAVPRLGNWLMMRPSRWVLPCGLFAILYGAAIIVPPAIEQLYVGPNQITLERPFLVRSIAGTREAYNLDGPSVEERSSRSLPCRSRTRIWTRMQRPCRTPASGLASARASTPADPRSAAVLHFAGVDIDRYIIDGAERQVLITARELNLDKLPDQAKVWVNLALKYTHGYGAVAVPVNEMDGRGNPVLWAHDIPVKAKGELAVTHGEIYYGALTRDLVYVRTTEKEFDFPRGQANAETVYEGTAGIPLSSFWCKLVVAHECDGPRLFISGYFVPKAECCCGRILPSGSKGWRHS